MLASEAIDWYIGIDYIPSLCHTEVPDGGSVCQSASSPMVTSNVILRIEPSELDLTPVLLGIKLASEGYVYAGFFWS